METGHITQFIDSWLADAPHALDNRSIDFALDLRLMVEALTDPKLEEARQPARV